MNMIKITGKTMKSEITNAIQHYNGAKIFSYDDYLPPFVDCWHVNSNEYSVKEFCEGIFAAIKEEVKNKEYLLLKMIVIYTNLDDLTEIDILYKCAEKIEEEHLVASVVVCSQ